MKFQAKPVGAFTTGRETEFTVWAPFRQSVEVLIEGREPEYLQAVDFGYFSKKIADVGAGARYWFRLDEKETYPDPASKFQPDGVHGPSEVVSCDFSWTDHNWKGMECRDMIIYELHVGTFSSGSDFEGIIDKLPYLKDLGITAIELMPVAQFPGNRNWGYDGVYPFAVQNSYGGPMGLKKLVNAAHETGIAVVLDVVYNHQGPEGNYLGAFGPYFTSHYHGPWGDAINFDGEYSDGVRNFYLQNALMWLNEFHIDALRLDAVHAIYDFAAPHIMEVLADKVRLLEKKTGVRKTLIAEMAFNNPRYINRTDIGGYGLDAQWSDEFHHALHALVTNDRMEYYSDFGNVQDLAEAYAHSYVYTGRYSVHRKRDFGVKPEHNTFDQFVIFAQNHDQIGNRMLGERLSVLISFEAIKLSAAAYLLAAQIPLLFMGEEYGETNPFQYFVSHSDKKLIAAVREGRKREFGGHFHSGEAPDPESEELFDQARLSFSFRENRQSALLLDYYKFLIALRKNHSAMQSRDRYAVFVHPVQNKLLAFERKAVGGHLLVILNFDTDKLLWTGALPENSYLLFDSSDKKWGGPGLDRSSNPLVINPQSAVIFSLP